MCSQQFAKVLRKARQRTPLVPRDYKRDQQRIALVGDAAGAQFVPMNSHDRRKYCHPMSSLGERQQGVRRLALDQNDRLESGETTSRIEVLAGEEAGVQQQQRMCRKAPDFDRGAIIEPKLRVPRCQKLQRWRRVTPESA